MYQHFFWSKVFNIVFQDDSGAEFWVFIQILLVFLKNFDFRKSNNFDTLTNH